MHPSTHAVGIRVEVDTSARIRVELRKRATGGLVAERYADGPRKAFVTFAGGLEHDTLYAIAVSATDSRGRTNVRRGTFRTLEPETILGDGAVGDLASDAGCAAQCIRTAQVEAGLRAARMTVNTDRGPVRFQVEVNLEVWSE